MPCLQNMSKYSCRALRCRSHLIYNVCTTLDIFLLNKDLCYDSNTIEHMIKCQPMQLWRDISATILHLSWYFICFVQFLVLLGFFKFIFLFLLLFLLLITLIVISEFFLKFYFLNFIPMFRFLQTQITKVRIWKSK